MRLNLLHLRTQFHEQNQRNELKQLNVKFGLWKKTQLENLAIRLLEGRQFLQVGFQNEDLTRKKVVPI